MENHLDQHVVDVSSINSFKIDCKKFELNPMSLTCGSTAVEATPGKEPG